MNKLYKSSCIITAAGLIGSCSWFQPKSQDNEVPNFSWTQDDQNSASVGEKEAGLATFAYSQGNFPEAETHLAAALKQNPKQPQALLVGGLLYEQMGRPNRSRQYYEDLMLAGGEQTSLLGSTTGAPEKMTDIAKKRLRALTLRQSELVIEEKDGSKSFAISNDASQNNAKSAMDEALFKREQRLISENKASSEADQKAVEALFTDAEKNIISRFLIIKELAEKDLITKEEFLDARTANLGGILPLTSIAPAAGIDRPVPSSTVIVDRINALKEALDARAITPREFSVERNLIVQAVLPPSPRSRMKNRAPSRDIMGAAKDMRKIEVLYDLNLITAKEKDKEQAAIESNLGINKSGANTRVSATPPPPAKTVASAPAATSAAKASPTAQTADAGKPTDVAPELLIPNVTQPF